MIILLMVLSSCSSMTTSDAGYKDPHFYKGNNDSTYTSYVEMPER